MMTSSPNNQFSGILPAVVTPLKDGRFWPAAFERLLEFVYAAGSDGIYVCGQTGEGLLLPAEERMRAVEAAVRCTPKGKTVIAHVGAYSAAEALALGRHAAKAGVHAISSLPPLAGHSFAEIRAYYQALASSCDVPLFIYYYPDVCAVINDTAQILELASLPNIAGLKFTDYNLYKLWLIKSAGHTVYNGRDECLAAGLLMGADGGIGTFYNLAPDWFVEVYRRSRNGDWDGAREIQGHINELIAVVLRFPVFGAVKTLLAWMGMDCGTCVAPRRLLTSEEERNLSGALSGTRFAQTHLEPVSKR